MAGCALHFEGSSLGGAVMKLSHYSCAKLKTAIVEWRSLLKEPERTLCQSSEALAVEVGCSIHKSCYARLTSDCNLSKARERHTDTPPLAYEETVSQQVMLPVTIYVCYAVLLHYLLHYHK